MATFSSLSLGKVILGVAACILLPLTGLTQSTTGHYLWMTGSNDFGQFGNGTNDPAGSKLVLVATDVIEIAAGYDHSLIIREDGSLWISGQNFHGQVGNGSTSFGVLGFTNIATNVNKIAAGASHSLYLTEDGALWGMGNNDYGQLGSSVLENKLTPIQIATGVVEMEGASYGNTYFLTAGGMLWGLGSNEYGQLGGAGTHNRTTPAPIAEGVIAFDGGLGHLAFVKADGTLWMIGYNEYGQLGDGSTTNRSQPVQIAANVVAVSTGDNHTHYLTSDGTLWGMGRNDEGELGDLTKIDRHQPVVIATGVSAIANGPYQLHFSTDSGRLYTTTRHGSHQRIETNFPTFFDAGANHAMILTSPPKNTCSFGEWIDTDCDNWVDTGSSALGWVYLFEQGDKAWMSVPLLNNRAVYADLTGDSGAWFYVPANGENPNFTEGADPCGFGGYLDSQCDGWVDTGAAMLGWIYYPEAGSTGWINVSNNNAWYYVAASDAAGAWLFMPY